MLCTISTFTTCSGSSYGPCPVCVTVCFPLSITIACVTHFLNAKSNSFNSIYSLSWSSSPSFHSPGVESSSSISLPFSSVSSEICAEFTITLSDEFGSTTLNATFMSL